MGGPCLAGWLVSLIGEPPDTTREGTGGATLSGTGAGRTGAGAASTGVPDRTPLADSIPRFYEEIREVAARLLASESHGQDATSLVHEVYVRWSGSTSLRDMGRSAFFALAGRELRRVIVERARKRRRRAALTVAMPARDDDTTSPVDRIDLLDLDAALTRLESRGDGRVARVVELRFLVGLTVQETAEALTISPATVKDDWAFGRAFLRDQLDCDDERNGASPT